MKTIIQYNKIHELVTYKTTTESVQVINDCSMTSPHMNIKVQSRNTSI